MIFGLAVLGVPFSASGASAQAGLRCSAFLHNRDGTWRSFYEADLLGPEGSIHVSNNERLDPAARTAKGEVARALNELCAGR